MNSTENGIEAPISIIWEYALSLYSNWIFIGITSGITALCFCCGTYCCFKGCKKPKGDLERSKLLKGGFIAFIGAVAVWGAIFGVAIVLTVAIISLFCYCCSKM
jgi:hypothetical protein